ncbi:MAG TPA: hypothetical protein VFO10_02770 [Oligoflexus sp.]|uniref:hypothetical protein n=1 Tax=Oligoflexus sp. TaxID=1971216 RepID=UPI002D7F56E8|nr:hypothetical protein [Oligoflexus sp.]HET9236145.1 hypothetical protein [Oligoflexus sp.]
MKASKIVIALVSLVVMASEGRSTDIETNKHITLSPDAYLGVYNSAVGAGLGLSADVSDRFTAGVRWFSGLEEDVDSYKKDFKSTRLYFEGSETRSDELSAFGRYRVLETLSVTGALDQKKSVGRIDISDKQNLMRRGQVKVDSTVYSLYAGIGNYWSGSWYKAGVDWLGISVPFSSHGKVLHKYDEPEDSWLTTDEADPSRYYSGVKSLIRDAKSKATDVGATLLLGNLSFIF